ncbi:MAG: DUF4301 family protein [Bacteroidota bacterium]
MFTSADLEQIESKGIVLKTIENQIEYFKSGFPYLKLRKAATIGDGILKVDDEKASEYVKLYDELSKKLNILKFVPASGAASRMFKDLYAFLDLYNGKREGYNDFMNSNGLNTITKFFLNIDKFAFHNDLKKLFENDSTDLEFHVKFMNYEKILNSLLESEGLNYGHLPKGLLKFHIYQESERTAIEEHLVEGVLYAKNSNGKVNIHFTISPEHSELVKSLIDSKINEYENKYSVSFDISYSIQKSSTDTIAVNLENELFRNLDNSLLFRPGGHGALIENLNDLDADLVFIKNIDNVVPDYLKSDTIKYKKIIAGVLIEYQRQINFYIDKIKDSPTNELIIEIENFLKNDLCFILPDKIADKVSYLKEKLDRPLRVCGMVKNEGEPGGGPYWAFNNDGSVSLQIVESSQIDFSVPDQKSIFEKASHFNPVDLVCSLKNSDGEEYDLKKFIDYQTGFISKKSKDGKELKALELPGLWNGAMADWNTIFVEVPISTFNPVKTIIDLLKKEHQPDNSDK